MNDQRYHPLSSILHWIMVIMLAWLIWGGRSLETFYERSGGDLNATIGAFSQHKAIGVAVFFLAVARIAIRMVTSAPPHEEGIRGLAALWVQRALYATLLIYPLTGFAFHSASTGFKTDVTWGPLTFPDLPIGGEGFWHQAHIACFYLLGSLLILHISGALFHLIVKRDGMFRRILPF